jgi:uncharacterized protein
LPARTVLRRIPERGSHDAATIHAILDAGFLAHVGFQVESQPFVVPTLYGREGEELFLHGSAASRMLRELETGVPACVGVTLVDGIVLARSAFNHSMNYRSVILFGTATKIADTELKTHALRVISEHVIPGRWNEVRGPSEKELKATTVLKFVTEEASAKIRSGPVCDDEEDYSFPAWAGILPLQLVSGRPVPDERLIAGIEVPAHVLRFADRDGHRARNRSLAATLKQE